MLKNNHLYDRNITEALSVDMLNQRFEVDADYQDSIEAYRRIAANYAKLENAVAVLSDLRSNRSYIFYGKSAARLGIAGGPEEIDSIWEKQIYDRIHPGDLWGRHALELRYFQLLKSLPPAERRDYHTESLIRMLNRNGEYTAVRHRTFFIADEGVGTMPLALCLYDFPANGSLPAGYTGTIVNSATGETVVTDREDCGKILTVREKELLRLIEAGKRSREIAALLSISIHTVNRHRQNILEKLRVNNSLEALKIARIMQLI